MGFPNTSGRRFLSVVFFIIAIFAPYSIAVEPFRYSSEHHQSLLKSDNQDVFSPPVSLTDSFILRDLHSALSTMQDLYFSLWLGKWTSAIDWNSAVFGSYLSAILASLSRSIVYTMPGTFHTSKKLDIEAQMVENEINKYFGQSVGYYFGEDHFSIRQQAYDDILWVVLGWLEATQFIEGHAQRHYSVDGDDESWHASQFIPAFSHRVRVFYDLAEQGWDWTLCGGGLTWNPRLDPYKNAITNELFISASIGLYLHFPGDDNCSPFVSLHDQLPEWTEGPKGGDLFVQCEKEIPGRYDEFYLNHAVNGYDWLKNVGMRNEQGLYVDGFHIAGYHDNHSKTVCDDRNEMIYSYNQGVVLSGLRGLWEATGNLSYLEDGHELIRDVIRATGWTGLEFFSMPSFTGKQPIPPVDNDIPTTNQDTDSSGNHNSYLTTWQGLGSHGILTELCDPSGRCNQDGQTFKGIFFHHLTTFCTPLPLVATKPGKTHSGNRETIKLHQNSCTQYRPWVQHNAQAALRTRDSSGRFGSWWAAPLASTSTPSNDPEYPFDIHTDVTPRIPVNAHDYRDELDHAAYRDVDPFANRKYSERAEKQNYDYIGKSKGDANDRGRGRTVETQGSGVAVVRAQYEFLRWAEEEESSGV